MADLPRFLQWLSIDTEDAFYFFYNHYILVLAPLYYQYALH